MIIIQTIGSIDLPGKGARKLPAPKQYLAIVVLWSILGLIADFGQKKFASRFAMVLVLTGAVMGPFGRRAVGLIQRTTELFNVAPEPQEQGE